MRLTPQNERDCVQGGTTNGPLHNNIPNPANASHKDNNSMWVPDFSADFYDQMLYTTTGIQQRVRTDLKGPDGKSGIDLRGYTMHNMYLEMSKGAYTVDGAGHSLGSGAPLRGLVRPGHVSAHRRRVGRRGKPG